MSRGACFCILTPRSTSTHDTFFHTSGRVVLPENTVEKEQQLPKGIARKKRGHCEHDRSFRMTGTFGSAYLGNRNYYSVQNEFERFLGFWNQLADSSSNFVAAKIIFLNDSNFCCVQSSIHTPCGCPCGCPCACAVACLHPHNSISNVMVFVTIHGDTYLNMCIYLSEMWRKNVETLWEVVRIVCYNWVFGGERQIGPSGGWFPPQCPSGELELKNFIR